MTLNVYITVIVQNLNKCIFKENLQKSLTMMKALCKFEPEVTFYYR